MNFPPNHISPAALARAAGLSPRAVQRAIDLGQIEATKLGLGVRGRLAIPLAEAAKLAEAYGAHLSPNRDASA